MQARHVVGFAGVSAAACAAVVVVAAQVTADGPAAPARDARAVVAVTPPLCPHPIPTGISDGAARRTAALFASQVVLRENPACGYLLSSTRLRRLIPLGRWKIGRTTPRAFVSRYPAVAYVDASSDPNAREAVYVVSRTSGLPSFGADGRPQMSMSIGVAAPDAGLAAYRLLLVQDGDGWRVDRWWRVAISSRDSDF